MKCGACGYEHEGEYNNSGYKHIKGDEKFIDVFTAHTLEIDNPEEPDDWNENYVKRLKVTLQACPKCNTVILNTDD